MTNPERTTALISTRIDRVLWRRIRQAAIEQGRTIQVVCEEAFVSWLAHQAVKPVVLVDPKDVEDLLERIPRRRLKATGERLAAKRHQKGTTDRPLVGHREGPSRDTSERDTTRHDGTGARGSDSSDDLGF